MNKYEKLDAAIIKAIGAGERDFTALLTGEVRMECERLAGEENVRRVAWRNLHLARILDRRLQSIRKAGKIRFARGSHGGWVLA